MDAIKEIEQMPPLPEMATMALVEGHQGSEYRILSNNYAPGHAMFSEKHMHAYAREYGSQLIAARDAEIAELKAALEGLDSYICNNITMDYPTGIDTDSEAFKKARALNPTQGAK